MSAITFIRQRPRAAVCVALAAVTLAVYAQVLRNDFISYDDPDYIAQNPHVTSGLTMTNIVWAFQGSHAANWHPLTWMLHMADCELFGLHPAGHHFVNVLFHVADSMLLFLLLSRMTNAIWRSAFVAAAFALHPLHVESVVWAAELKDVLSAFFFLLALLAYVQFADLWKVQKRRAKNFYIFALFLFACGLMSKPMVVTLPCVLLLLDFWPLRRFAVPGSWQRLLLEKIPFFLLSIAACIITARAQRVAMWSPGLLPLSFRVENAAVSYVRYLSKIFWPSDLALIYPYPHHWPTTLVPGVAALLLLLTTIFILQIKHFPYLAVGWFWFLGMLVPVIGIVQVGVQAMADRYAYLPSIGIFILVAWGANDLTQRAPRLKRILPAAAGAALAGCIAVTSVQLTYWRNSIEIFWHTIKVTDNNYSAYDCFGHALDSIGKTKEAEEFFAAAVKVEPDFPSSQFHLGMVLLERGDFLDASNHLAEAVRLDPSDPVMQFNFATFQSQHGDPKIAAEHFEIARKLDPDLTVPRKQ
ncbi:MAG TPA: hypothetical protein VFV23_08235 [Verrucomicrobiae bacterium]|nr:hypothetical protein [Verrucomicrobiae bacterium]